jgi:L-amino acid N-acyltransferase YncA
MNLKFRNAFRADLDLIVAIYNSTVPGRMVTADTEPVSTESRVAWFEAHEPLHRPLWIVYVEEQIIGWVSFQSFYGRPAYQGTAEISIYLDEKQRGKGYGKQILDHAMASCAELKIKTLVAYIFGHNVFSISLFKKAGFEQWGYFPGIAELDGKERDLVILGKRINK